MAGPTYADLTASQLGDTGGTDTGQDPNKPESALGRLAGVATSGEKFLGAVSGGRLDISGLPGYLRTPIDILANPISIGSILAAPFTGGASLAELGVAGVGARVAGVAAEQLAGGLAGGAVAQTVGNALPKDAPDWLKFAAPVGAGLVGGGLAARGIGSRLPGALPRAFNDIGAPGETAADMYSAENLPMYLKGATPGKTVANKVADFAKTLTQRGVISNEHTTPIIDQLRRYGRTVEDEAQVALQETRADLTSPEIKYIKDANTGGGAHYVLAEKLSDTPIAEAPGSTALPEVPEAGAAGVGVSEEALQAAKDHNFGAAPMEKEPPFYGSWIMPDGREMNTSDLDHSVAAGHMGETVNSLEDKGWVRRAGTGVFQMSPGPTAEQFKNLEPFLARDSAQVIKDARGTSIKNPTLIVDIGGDTENLSVYADKRAAQIAELLAHPKDTKPVAVPRKSMPTRFDEEPPAPDKYESPYAKWTGPGSTAKPPVEPPVAPERGATPGWYPMADVQRQIDNYRISPDLQNRLNNLSDRQDTWARLLLATKNKGNEADIAEALALLRPKDMTENGRYLTRGRPIEDGTEQFVAQSNRGRTLVGTPGPMKNTVYNSVAEGVANGEVYPAMDQAMVDYIRGVGNSALGQHALNQLRQLTDGEGNPLILDLQHRVPLTDPTSGEIIRGEDGKPVFQDYQQAVPRGYAPLESLPGSAAKPEIASAINAQMRPNGALATASRLSEMVNQPLRTLHTVFDFAYNARIGITAATMHPFVFARALAKGYEGIFNDTVVGQEFKAINGENLANGLKYTVSDMARDGLHFSNPDLKAGFLSNAPVVGKLSKVYSNSIDILRARMMQSEMGLKGAAGLNVADPTIARQIANGINLTTGASVGPPVKGANILVQFPNWLQSQVEFIAKSAAGGGLDGQYARQAMLRMLGTATAATVIGNKLSGHLNNWQDAGKMFNNGVPTLYIGNQKIDLFGPYGSLFRGAVAALEGNPEPLIRGKASPMLQIGWDLATGTTFSGDKAEFADPNYWLKMMEPYGMTSVGTKGPLTGALDALGVKASEITPVAQRNNLVHQIYGKDYVDMTGKERLLFQNTNPELFASIHDETMARAAAGDKTAQGVVATQSKTDQLISTQAQLMAQLKGGQLTPQQFRTALNNASHDISVQKQQIRADFGLDKSTKTPTQIQSALDRYYKLYTQADQGVIDGGKPTGQINWDTFDALSSDLMTKLTPEQQKAVTDRATPHDPSIQWFYDNKDKINSTGYFDTTKVAIEKFQSSINKVVPGATTMTDLQQAQASALAKGDRGTYAYTTALINRVNAYAGVLKTGMRVKDPSLTQALVQNGYVSQPKYGAMIAPGG